MTMGRPTKYCPEIIEQTQQYLDTYKELGDVIPTIAGLACELHIPRETLHRWIRDDDKPDFRHIMGELMAKQERMTLSGSMSGDLNSTISKLVLTKHGYSDKVEQKASGEITIKVSEQDTRL